MGSETAALQPRIVPPENTECLKPFGIDMKVMIGAAATGGTFSALLVDLKPGDGPPPHLHHDREEYFFVIEGTYRMSVNGDESTIGPGTLVFVPRGTVHAFSNIGTTTGRLLEWTIPGTNEPYFRAVHEMETGGFDIEKLAEINRRFDTEFAGAGAGGHD